MSDPGAVLVHGLWHGAWCWDAREALDTFGRPGVLVGHSYGGAVIYLAAFQLDEDES